MSSNNIDIIGTLQNLKDQGFNVKNSASEKTDNSLDWKSQNITIKLNTNTNIGMFIDDGTGMDMDGLVHAMKLNGRSQESNDKQGKYGIGLPQSLVVDTQLNGTAQIISKPRDKNDIYSIKIDFQKCVKNREYITIATEASSSQERMFNDNSIQNYGTIIIEEYEKSKMNELVAFIKSCDVSKSLLYEFGYKYADQLKIGKKIQFWIDDDVFDVMPVDPLCMDNIANTDKQIVQCDVYSLGLERRVFYKKNGILGYNEKPGKRVKFTKSDIPEDWIKDGSFIIESAYSSNWDRLQKHIIANIEEDDQSAEPHDDDVDVDEPIKKVHERSKFMGGRYYNRNLKCIDKVSIEQPTVGDKDRYKYVTDSRHRIKFPVELDVPFDIQVNKSRIREENICPKIFITIIQISNDFVSKMYKLYRQNNDSDSDSVPEPETIVPETIVPETIVPETIVPETIVPDTIVPETIVPETIVPDTIVPETIVPETIVPETIVPETIVSETIVPETILSETILSETIVSETIVPDTIVPETIVPETIVPETILSETIVPETIVPETIVPETIVPETINPETIVPETIVPETNIPIVIRDIGPSKHTTISVKYGLQLLTKADESVLDTLLFMYFDKCAKDQIQCMLDALNGKITEKRNILIRMIESRYMGNIETDFLGGAELIRYISKSA